MKALLQTAKLTALTFAVGMSLLPATALALPTYDRVVTYYDGPDSYNEVGEFIMNCTGHSSLIGQRTPWYSEILTACEPDSVPPRECPQGWC
jgi:hypothetical protein